MTTQERAAEIDRLVALAQKAGHTTFTWTDFRAALEAALDLGEPVAWVPRAIKDLPGFHKMKKGEFVWEDADPDAPPAVSRECFEVVAVYAAKEQTP